MTREAAKKAWKRRTVQKPYAKDEHDHTDNDPVTWPLKLAIRLAVLERVEQPDVPQVLDAFAGEGHMWRAVQKYSGREIDVTGVDTRAIPGVIKADNRKALAILDLDRFDLIDLDAYGTPADQAKIIARRGWFGPIIWTAISVSKGNMPRAITNAEGLPAEWTEQTTIAHSEHYRDPLARRWCRYLTMLGWEAHDYFTPPSKFIRIYGSSGHREHPVDRARLHFWYNVVTTTTRQEVEVERNEDPVGQ